MTENDCEAFIKSNSLLKLLEWLNSDQNHLEIFWTFVNNNLYKSSPFLCEHSFFVYSGKIKRSMNIFKDDDMNMVASSLGSSSVYSEGTRINVKDQFLEVKNFKRPESFMDIFSKACQNVDEDLAFSAIMQIIPHTKEDFYPLLKILSNVITRSKKAKSSLVTNSLVLILRYIEERKEIMLDPLLEFLEYSWEYKDEQDAHGVGPSSLKSFCTRIIVELISGNIKPLDSCGTRDDYCLKFSNLVCKFHNNIFRWVSSLSNVTSEPISGPLDNIPLYDAVCLFILLKDSKSLIPRVYNMIITGIMVFKLSNIFLLNVKKGNEKLNLPRLAIEAGDIAISQLEKLRSPPDFYVLNDNNTFPWHPIGYFSTLLGSEEFDYINKNCNRIFKKVISLCSLDLKLHILKGVMKSVNSELGTCICLMECKNLSTTTLFQEIYTNAHLSFFKNIMDSYFDSKSFKLLHDSIFDSLSITLNWIKFLFLCKDRLLFKKIVKENYLEGLQNLYNKLEDYNKSSEPSHTLHISDLLSNKLDLIKMLFLDFLNLINEVDQIP